MPVDPRDAFAALINAKRQEISYIPNTSSGENLVVEALDITRFDGNVVTDALHFEGASGALAGAQEARSRPSAGDAARGSYRYARPGAGRGSQHQTDRGLAGLDVQRIQHDLKAVCDLAHAHGAYVYADIIQGVGTVPLDVRATGVDFAATATYKWLMGDFGLGLSLRARRAAWHRDPSQALELRVELRTPTFIYRPLIHSFPRP